MVREACERDEFRTPASPPGLEIVQITADTKRDSSAFYLDCVSWTPDSRRFVFPREASDDQSQKPGLWLCDTADGFAIQPLLEYDRPAPAGREKQEGGSYGAILSPDGSCLYHLRYRSGSDVLTRVPLDGSQREEEVAVAPTPMFTRGLGTMSADSRHVLAGCWLGDGKTEGAPWGARIFDVTTGQHWLIEFGNGFRNMHCQYSHNPAEPDVRDVMVLGTPPRLSDGSWLTPPDGSWRWQNLPPDDGLGAVHLILRDDGTDRRMLPIARQRDCVSGGHCTWRGRENSVVAACYHHPPGRWRSPLFEAAPTHVATPEELWLGAELPGGKRVDLTRKLARADSCHFGFDGTGRHLVSDTDGYAIAPYSFLWVGTYVEPPGEDPSVVARYLLLPRTSWKTQPAHPHAFLSPDGRYVVFQSDFTGRPQVYVAHNFEYP